MPTLRDSGVHMNPEASEDEWSPSDKQPKASPMRRVDRKTITPSRLAKAKWSLSSPGPLIMTPPLTNPTDLNNVTTTTLSPAPPKNAERKVKTPARLAGSRSPRATSGALSKIPPSTNSSKFNKATTAAHTSRQKKPVKRRKVSGDVYRPTNDEEETEQEYVLTKNNKRRKISDTDFRPSPADEDSDDHFLTDSRRKAGVSVSTSERSSRKNTPKRAFSGNASQGPSAKRHKKDVVSHVPEGSVEPVTASLLPVPTASKATTGQKKRKQASEDPAYSTPGSDPSSEDEDVSKVEQANHKRVKLTPREPAEERSPSAKSIARTVKEPDSNRSTRSTRSTSAAPKGRRPSLYSGADARRDAAQEADEMDLLELDTSLDSDVRYTNARLEQLRKEKAMTQSDMKHEMADWLDGEKEIFHKLSMRAIDPQLPTTWKLDFPTLPHHLFALDDEYAPIGAIDKSGPTSDFRANKAFRELTLLGSHARDKTLLQERPEKVIERGIRRYHKWTTSDAKLHEAKYTQHFTIIRDDTDTVPNPTWATEKLTWSMRSMAKYHRDVYRREHDLQPTYVKVEAPTPKAVDTNAPESATATPTVLQRLFSWTGLVKKAEIPSPQVAEAPETESLEASDEYVEVMPDLPEDMGTIYGILISHLVFQVVTYNIAEPEGEPRSMIVGNFADDDHDVWNALALALTVCHTRDENLKTAVMRHRSIESDNTDE